MSNLQTYFLVLCVLSFVSAFNVRNQGIQTILSKWLNINTVTKSSIQMISFSSMTKSIRKSNRRFVMMSETEIEVPTISASTESPAPTTIDEFSQFAVGQEYEGKVMSAKKFGVFVDIGKSTNVLVPRSQLSTTNFDKLKALVDAKSQDKIRVELITVSEANKTLSGKYISGKFKSRPDLSTIDQSNLESKQFNATIVSSHDFGVFAEIEELGVEGLIPASKLPGRYTKEEIKKTFIAGNSITVKIDEVNIEGKKLVLSAKFDNRISTPSASSNFAAEKWIQGVVQSVTSFGIFIRPAGFDNTGLLHQSRIPRELISALKKYSPITPTPGSNKTDIESLFQAGDVFKIRIQSMDIIQNRIELSALPFKSLEDDDDDINIIEDEDEGKEDKKGRSDREEAIAEDSVAEDDEGSFNALSTLVWWRNQPFDKIAATLQASEVTEDVQEELEILRESRDVVEGTWRRMFELDMREDELDFSAKAAEAELKELEEEIGELNGLDDELGDSFGLGTRFMGNTLGARFVFPEEWKEQLSFYKELEESASTKTSIIRGGKKADNLEFDGVIREIELDLDRAAAKKRPEASAEVVEAVSEQISAITEAVAVEAVNEVDDAAAESVEAEPVAEIEPVIEDSAPASE